MEEQVAGGARAPAGDGRQDARRPRRPAARLRPLRRPRVDARHARHGPQPRPQRRVGRGPRAGDGQRALRVGLLPALRAHVRQRRARHRRGRLRGRRATRRSWSSATSRSSRRDRARTSRRTRASSCAQAIRAVFDSWQGERAVAYRRAEGIPDEWGTAVNVQQMVFGNKGETSGSGVAFSRDFATGAPGLSGDFLIDAQGEDVVSGNRSTLDIARDGREAARRRTRELVEHVKTARAPLPQHAGRRVHRRGGAALLPPDARRQAPAGGVGALRRATRSTRGCSTIDEALLTFKAGDLEPLLHEQFDPTHKVSRAGQGRRRVAGRRQGRRRLHRARTRSPPRSRASSCGPRRGPTTTRAWPPPRASSPARAATARTPRWSRAARAGRA